MTNTTYKVRKRVPRCLVDILNGRREINRTFKTKVELHNFNTLIDESVAIVNSGLPIEIVSPLVLQKGLEEYRNKESFNGKIMNLHHIVSLYLNHSKKTVTKIEYNNRVDFFTKLLPALFEKCNIDVMADVSKITSKDMYNVSQKIEELPNRRLYKYRNMEINKFVQLDVPQGERLLPDSANKLIKRIKSLANYGMTTGLYTLVNTIPTIKCETSIRDALTAEDYYLLSKVLPKKAKLLLDIVYYSGLRSSEIHKATIDNVDNILVFDLTASREKLKTKSSYRYVPLHSKLIPYVQEINELSYEKIKRLSKTISRHCNQVLNGKKSLYSARHAFITNLVKNGVPTERVSELAGHSHNTTTLKIYFAGYPIVQLQSDIELLK